MTNIAKVNATSATDFTFTETDPDSNFIWYYRINGFSKCGRSLGKSNISNNIRLNLTYTLQERKLNWNNYGTWPTGVDAYEIYRTTVEKGITNEDKIASLNKDANSFADIDIAESDAKPGICYYVKAVEKAGNPFGLKKESYSNFTCYTVPPIVNIPNAFNPHDIYNRAFFPVVLYADTMQSTYTIYNRWGESIFTNQPIWKSWDGKLANGKDAPEGVYFYKAIVVGIDNSTKVYSAGFTLL
jgi:gliding motility-associated-like protein